uniref:Uncharacterized protein n=1 Tax=Anguilla anguilla TaxID=7936 RepID=A0A0E9WL90_ANGAN
MRGRILQGVNLHTSPNGEHLAAHTSSPAQPGIKILGAHFVQKTSTTGSTSFLCPYSITL